MKRIMKFVFFLTIFNLLFLFFASNNNLTYAQVCGGIGQCKPTNHAPGGGVCGGGYTLVDAGICGGDSSCCLQDNSCSSPNVCQNASGPGNLCQANYEIVAGSGCSGADAGKHCCKQTSTCSAPNVCQNASGPGNLCQAGYEIVAGSGCSGADAGKHCCKQTSTCSAPNVCQNSPGPGSLCQTGYTSVAGSGCFGTDAGKNCCVKQTGPGVPPPINYGGAFGGPGTTLSCGSGANDVWTLDCIFPLLASLILWALTLAGTAGVIFIIVGGIRIISSDGDPKKIDQGRKAILFAIVGLIVIFLSFFILRFIGTTTGIACLNPNATLSFTSCAGGSSGGGTWLP